MRRISYQRSFKQLFPQLSTTTNFRHTKKSLINQLKNKFNKKLINNISGHPLTAEQIDTLSLGLNFVPSPPHQKNAIQTSLHKFSRAMKTQYHFRNSAPLSRSYPFQSSTNWTPPEPNQNNLNLFFSQIQENTTRTQHTSKRDNLNPYQKIALKELQSNNSIIIKPFDKGGGICVMDTEQYINKIFLHLNDSSTYKKLKYDPTQAIRNDVMSTLEYLHHTHKIDEKTFEFLTPPNPARTPLFYGLPKVHKPGIPLRPIVSACDSPTDNISKYVTYFIQPLAEQLPSYIKDTKHFLEHLNSLPPLPPNAILVTADVTSLYTNIPHEEGIEAVLHYMRIHKNIIPSPSPSPHTIAVLIDTILKNNNLSFLDLHFLQVVGTAMGTKMAPPYSNCFMGRQEEKIRENFISLLLFWKRFIDDIFFIFLGTFEELNTLKDFMNNLHPTIKFTFTQSLEKISFLDLMIYKTPDHHLATTIFRKPTDCAPLLHFQSNHSLKCKESIIFSQALRYNLIISDDKNLEKELDHLTLSLITRNYPLEIIIKNIQKALEQTRNCLLQKVRSPKGPENILPFITPFCTEGQALSQKINKGWKIIEKDPELSRVWPSRPITAYTKTKSLKDLLVHSRQRCIPNNAYTSDP